MAEGPKRWRIALECAITCPSRHRRAPALDSCDLEPAGLSQVISGVTVRQCDAERRRVRYMVVHRARRPLACTSVLISRLALAGAEIAILECAARVARTRDRRRRGSTLADTPTGQRFCSETTFRVCRHCPFHPSTCRPALIFAKIVAMRATGSIGKPGLRDADIFARLVHRIEGLLDNPDNDGHQRVRGAYVAINPSRTKPVTGPSHGYGAAHPESSRPHHRAVDFAGGNRARPRPHSKDCP